MAVRKWVVFFLSLASVSSAATIGNVVTLVGGASDIVLDEARNRLYLVNSSQDRVEVYSILQRRFLTSIRTDALPLAAAMSRSGKYLYVTCHNGSSLNAIDLDRSDVVSRVSLPAKPEGVAVGGDERVLITTIGTGPNNSQNTLLLYDPNAAASAPVSNVLITPPAPQPPQLPPLAGRIFLANRSQLLATRDGAKIIGVNAFNQSQRVVFVYDVPSAAVLRSRYVGDASTVLSLSPDGSKFMMGLRLFDTETLTVLAQMNAANAPFPLTTNLNTQGFNQVAQQFNLQQNQGGSTFAPDGSFVFGAFNIAPIQNPPARANVTQLFVCDPDNLLIYFGLQLPENLAGKMVAAPDGSAIYALSDSGFTVIPLAQLQQSPIAIPETTATLVANDQCGVTASLNTQQILVRNEGRGRMTASATLLQAIGLAPAGLGGATGPGGGIIGGGGRPVVVFPPQPGAGLPGTLPGGFGNVNTQQAQFLLSAPRVQVVNTPDGPQLSISFNPAAGRQPGTVYHDFLIQSPEAVNIPPMLRVFQNQRDPEARADVLPIPVNYSPNEGLVDIVMDTVRQRIYIANSGLNRVEVFDIRQKKFLAPIKVGQLPRALALTPDANTLYVANSGGESISIVDLNKMQAVGRVKFPPIPFNGNLPVITPSAIAATQRGLQIVMSDGTLWSVVGDEAIPRRISPAIQTNTVPAPRTMTATPNGEYALLLDGQGYAYLYDALMDEYVIRRQVVTAPIQGYYGPVAAGPRGRYYLVNGLILNEALTPIQSAGTVGVVTPGRGTTTVQNVVRPIPSVAAVNNTTVARFSLPARASANVQVTDTPTVELVDVNTGSTVLSAPALEGPISTVVGNQRVNTVGRSMVVDPAGSTAYVLTTSGLSIVPLERTTTRDRPAINRNGIVNYASYLPNLAPNTLASIFGVNLGSSATASSYPLPTILGGVCVTANNTPLPLLMTSPGQINLQIPPDFTATRYSIVVHDVENKVASAAQNITLTKYAPAVLVDPDGQPAIFHQNGGDPVTRDNPAKRDQPLVMYAVGLGPVKNAKIIAGQPSPADPPAEVDNVSVYFGDPRIKEAAIIVDWAGLVPNLVGLYQLNLRVPGAHISSRGAPLPVTVRVGGVDSPTDGPAVPKVWVE